MAVKEQTTQDHRQRVTAGGVVPALFFLAKTNT